MDVSERMAAALQRLEEALQAAGLPLPTLLAPGLPAERIEQLVGPTGLRLPDEAVVLWRWHDGVTSDPDARRSAVPGAFELPGGGTFLPLEDAVGTWQRSYDHRDWPVTTDLTPDWFPVVSFDSSGALWCDSSVDPGEPTPVRWVDVWDIAPADVAAARTAPSLAEAFDAMTDLVTSGLWRLIGPDDFPAMTGYRYDSIDDPPADNWFSRWP